MSDEQKKQLALILAAGDIRQISFNNDTMWEHVRVAYVMGGWWFHESIQRDGSVTDRILVEEAAAA